MEHMKNAYINDNFKANKEGTENTFMLHEDVTFFEH